jgi:protein-S-isoprenylcysteine O-methyltransferase Ste14
MSQLDSTLTPVQWPAFVRVGRWWFQNRSLSPIPLFLLLVVLGPNFQLQPIGYVLALFGIFACEALRIWAVGFAGGATRTRGDKVPQLVHAGPYRFVRNPLYIANIGMYTLCGVVFGFSYLSIFIFLYSVVQYTFIVRFEEEILERSFGLAYKDYKANVPRWLPLRSPYRTSSHLFSLSRALRSERSTFFSMTLMAILFFVKPSR